MAFGDAKRFVDRSNKFARNGSAANDGVERLNQRGVQHPCFCQEYVGTVWLNLRQIKQLSAAFRGNDTGGEKEAKKALPGEAGRRAKLVYEFKGQTATNEVPWIRDGGHSGRLNRARKWAFSAVYS